MTIKAIVFDVGGVLKITPSTGQREKWNARLNLQPDELHERLNRAGKNGTLGDCTEEEWLVALREVTGIDQAQTDEFMDDLWVEYLGTLNVELRDYFASLRPKYQTAIISNSFLGARRKEQDAYGFEDLCGFIIYSHEVGLLKPNAAIYELACKRLALSPSEVIFLDDVDVYIDGANAIGIHGIQFKDNAQAIADIEACIAANAS